jgi:hypothetical protein
MTTLPIALNGHELARDRAPVDCPIRITTWRYRWHCSCGATGTWQAVASRRIYWDWVTHTRRVVRECERIEPSS